MGTSQSIPVGPDLGLGIVGRDLADGSMLVGHVGAETVLIARRGDEFSPSAPTVHIMADLWWKG